MSFTTFALILAAIILAIMSVADYRVRRKVNKLEADLEHEPTEMDDDHDLSARLSGHYMGLSERDKK